MPPTREPGRESVRAHTAGADATRALAAALAPLLQPGDVLVLVGDLGAGKTTFVQGLAGGLGVTGPVTSPTFTIAQRYAGRLTVQHLDVYRLDTVEEAHDIGLAELVDDDGVAVVEWGDKVDALLPHDRLEVDLHFVEVDPVDGAEGGDEGDDDRTLELRAVGPTWMARREALASALAPWTAR